MEDLSPAFLAGAACAILLVLALLARTLSRSMHRRRVRARAPMDTDEFVAAMPQAGRDRGHRRLALAVRAAVAAHARVAESAIYPTDPVRALGLLRGTLTASILRRGMEQQLGKKLVMRASDALTPAAHQTLAAFINQVARGVDIVD